MNKFSQETVFEALSIIVIDLSDHYELDKVHDNVLNLILFTGKQNADIFSRCSPSKLHNCYSHLAQSQLLVIAPIKRKLYHLNALVDFWFNNHVKGNGTH